MAQVSRGIHQMWSLHHCHASVAAAPLQRISHPASVQGQTPHADGQRGQARGAGHVLHIGDRPDAQVAEPLK